VDRSIPARLECQALGFPWWKAGARRAQVDGYIPTAEGGGDDDAVLTLRITDQQIRAYRVVEGDQDIAGSPWMGMSGAGVVAGERILGVVRSHAPAEGVGSLALTPVSAIDQLPSALADRFWDALGCRAEELAMLPEPDDAGPQAAEIEGAWAELSGTVVLPPDEVATTAAFSPFGSAVAVAGSNGIVTLLWCDGRQRRFPASATHLVFAGEHECWFTEGHALFVLDTRTGTRTGPVLEGTSIEALSAGGEWVVAVQAASAGTQGRVVRIDRRTRGSVSFESPVVPDTALAVSPDGAWCAFGAGTQTRRIVVMRLADGHPVATLPVAPGPLACSPDGLALAVANVSGILLWRNAQGGGRPTRMMAPMPRTMAFAANGRLSLRASSWSAVLDLDQQQLMLRTPWEHCVANRIVGGQLVTVGTEADPAPPVTALPGTPRRKRLMGFLRASFTGPPGGLMIDVRPLEAGTPEPDRTADADEDLAPASPLPTLAQVIVGHWSVDTYGPAGPQSVDVDVQRTRRGRQQFSWVSRFPMPGAIRAEGTWEVRAGCQLLLEGRLTLPQDGVQQYSNLTVFTAVASDELRGRTSMGGPITADAVWRRR
jgi:hypothetical protein